MSNLLLNEVPLMCQPSLATKIGLNEAIFIQQLHYWLNRSTNYIDNRIWVYNTIDDWHKQFPFWSITTIRRIITSLEKKKLIITANYNKINIDRTKWYTINYSALDELENKDTAMNTNKSTDDNNTENSENNSGINEQSKLPKWTNGKSSDKTSDKKEEFSENKSTNEQSISPIWTNASVQIDKLDRPDWTNASVQNEQTNTINNNRNYLQENTTTINSENISVVDNIFNTKAKKKTLTLLAIKCGIQSKSIKTFFSRYSLEVIEKQLLLLEKALKNNCNIKNPSGWLCSALQNDYTDSEKETIILKEQTKQENTIKANKQEKLQRKALGLDSNSKLKKQLDKNTRIKNLETLRAFINSI